MAARRTNALGAIALLFALMVLFVAPAALARTDEGTGKESAPGQDKKQEQTEGSTDTSTEGDRDGDADDDANTAYTEDDDTNDGNTPNGVADEGDNAHPSGKDRSVENGPSGNQGNSESDPDDDGRGPDRSNGGPDKPDGSGGVDLADQDGNNGCGNDDDFEDDNEGWCGKPDTEDEVQPTATCPAGTTMHGDKCVAPQTNDICPAGTTMQGDHCVAPVIETCPAGTTMQGDACAVPTTVEGEQIDRCEWMGDMLDDFLCGPKPRLEGAPAAPAAPETTVLGERLSRGGPEVAAAAVAPAVAPAVEAAGAALPFTGSGGVASLLIAGLALIVIGALVVRARGDRI